MEIEIRDDATDAEAAAIAAVLRQVTAEAAQSAAAEEPAETHDPWRFAGRIDGLQSRRVRIPTGAPNDAWSAAGRADRF